jgi:hypothetical protein
MWDFSDDEWLAGAFGAMALYAFGWRYYRALAGSSMIGRSHATRLLLALFPLLAMLPALATLWFWADTQVAGHEDYVLLFLVVGSGILFFSIPLSSVLGISFTADVLDRDNPAARIVLYGMMTAIGLIYAGANVGAGPTIWTTLLPAVAGIVALGLAWLLSEIVGNVSELITINRDKSAAIRSAGMLIGCALIRGRAAGGQWINWQQTGNDLLKYAWPVVPLAFMAGAMHRILAPTPANGALWRGVVPGMIFGLAGFGWIVVALNGLHPWQW